MYIDKHEVEHEEILQYRREQGMSVINKQYPGFYTDLCEECIENFGLRLCWEVLEFILFQVCFYCWPSITLFMHAIPLPIFSTLRKEMYNVSCNYVIRSITTESRCQRLDLKSIKWEPLQQRNKKESFFNPAFCSRSTLYYTAKQTNEQNQGIMGKSC